MAGRPRSSKVSANPPSERPPAEPGEALDFAAWARRALDGLPDDVPEDERAILAAQVEDFTEAAPSAAPPPPDPTAPRIVRDRDDLKAVGGLLAEAPEVAIALKTSSPDPRAGEVVGVGLAVAGGCFYLPVHHRSEADALLRPDQLPLGWIVDELPLGRLPLVAHDAKLAFRWLRRHAGVACTFTWDTMIAARLLRSDQPADLKNLAARELDVPDWGPAEADIGRAQFLPIERVANDCGKDCRYTLELYRRQRACLA